MKKALFTSKIRLVCGTAAILLSAVPVMAQEVAPEAETSDVSESAAVDDASIIVTGTRVNREGYLAPTPVTAIGRDTIEAQAATTIADVLYDIPSVRPSPNFPATSQASGNYVNLRGLGATRTLTLVDGRRFVPSNGAENTGGSSVDINLIPEALVDRLDVVSGGASAAWGSDAVGGVVNIVLKRKLQGIQGKVQYGVSDYGDAQEISLSLAAGTSFADGRGQLMLAGEYSKSWDVPTTNDRPYGKDQCGFFPGTVDGTFYLGLQTCGLTHNSYTRGGVLVAADGNPLASTDPLYGRQFLNSTSSAPFDYGQIGPINRSVSIGGDGEWRGVRNLQAPLERKILFGRALYEFSPNVTGFIEASYGESGTETDLFVNAVPSSTDYPIAIRNGNPYIPADIQGIMDANGIDTIYLSKIAPELGSATSDSNNRVFRVATGLEGEMGKDWSWKAYGTFGRDWYDTILGNNIVVSNLAAATDVTINPLTGQPDCRVNVEGPAAPGEAAYGAASFCVPANPFGPGSLASAKDYIVDDLYQSSVYTQVAAGASINGEPFSTWAGPVSFVAGVDYRWEKVTQDVSFYADFLNPPLFASGGFQQSNPKSFAGDYTVIEGFSEVVVPILADVKGAEALDLNGAIRVTDYSTSGTVVTWKVGTTYEPVRGFRFRAAYSKDIRAPSLFESYGSNTTYSSVITRGPGGVETGSANAVSPGRNNLGLSPERAYSTTVGITMEDLLTRGLTLSIDGYRIKLKDVIGKLGAQGIIDGCFGGGDAAGRDPNPALCDLINADQTVIIDPFLNLGSIETQGIEFDLGYRFGADVLFGNSTGQFSFRLLANYVDKYKENSSGLNPRDLAGDLSGVPHWRWNATLAYNDEKLGVSLRGNFIDSMYRYKFAAANTYLDEKIPAYFYLDANVRYNIVSGDKSKIQLFANVDNILNTKPPFSPGSGSTGWFGLPGKFAQYSSYTNGTFYDVLGRTYKIGARFSF